MSAMAFIEDLLSVGWLRIPSLGAEPGHGHEQASRTGYVIRRRSAILRSVSDETAAPIRILLVDDHAVVRRGLRGFLELQDDMEVVGEGEDGTQAVALAQQHRPDVILMDLLMPKMDGLTAIATIKQAHPEVEIVAVTSFIEEEKVTAALEAGASGYLLKDAEAEEVADAIRAAYAGEVHLDPAVARLLAQRMRSRKDEEPVEPLTAREKEVLAQLAKGASNKEIAYELDITERTARTHVSNILGKLGLASRTQAALWAVEHKLT
jgi:DNA-binding NarL/FixJ family response regulator